MVLSHLYIRYDLLTFMKVNVSYFCEDLQKTEDFIFPQKKKEWSPPMRVGPAVLSRLSKSSVPGVWSDLAWFPSSRLLERHFRGLKAVSIFREKGKGRNRCKTNQSNKSSRSQILSFQDIWRGEILWNMDAEKEMSFLTKKIIICCRYSHSKSEKWPLQAVGFNLTVSTGVQTRDRGTKPVFQILAFSGLLLCWFNSLWGVGRTRGYHHHG